MTSERFMDCNPEDGCPKCKHTDNDVDEGKWCVCLSAFARLEPPPSPPSIEVLVECRKCKQRYTIPAPKKNDS